MSASTSIYGSSRYYTRAKVKRTRRQDVQRLLREWIWSASHGVASCAPLLRSEVRDALTLVPVVLFCLICVQIGHGFDKVARDTIERRLTVHTLRKAEWKRSMKSLYKQFCWRVGNYRVYRKIYVAECKSLPRAPIFTPATIQMPRLPSGQVRYSAVGLVVISSVLAFFVFPHQKIDPRVERDLSVPAWAQSVAPWKDLVNKVSHEKSVAYTHAPRFTNILSETITTVVNSNETPTKPLYVAGQERLLYLMILMGSNGNSAYRNGLCPLTPARAQLVANSMTAATGIPVSSQIEGKDMAENSLRLCGYLINAISDQLLSQPKASIRYSAPDHIRFARDLAFNWTTGSRSERTKFANTFAKLYADWDKPVSHMFSQLRKEQ